jgi:hypothetical protein
VAIRTDRRVRTYIVILFCVATARGAVIFDSTYVPFTPTAVEFGRISRGTDASNWGGAKPFPGVINAGTPYRYETFTVNSGIYPFLQISMDDLSENLFISAYLNSFNPVPGQSVNYLGDPGASQDGFFGNPSVFQIVVAPNTTLVLPVNETTVGGGTGAVFDVLVEGFFSRDFSETPPIPEPGSLILVGTAAAGALWKRRRSHRHVSQDR